MQTYDNFPFYPIFQKVFSPSRTAIYNGKKEKRQIDHFPFSILRIYPDYSAGIHLGSPRLL